MSKEYLDKAGLTYLWGKLKAYFQVKLVSGTNIKTVNNNSLLGSGNISITGNVTGVKGSAESSYRTGNVNLTASNVGAVGKSDEMQTTNPFAPNSLRGPYISKIDNAFYAADKRWTVTSTGTGTISNLFDGSYETNYVVPSGATNVITMDFTSDPSGYFPGYPYGYILVSVYYTAKPSSISCRAYCNYEPHGIGWFDISLDPMPDNGDSNTVYRGRQPRYNISKIEFTITGQTTGTYNGAFITQIEMHLDRPDSRRNPFLSKYGEETLYYNLTAPKFIGSLAQTSKASEDACIPSKADEVSFYRATTTATGGDGHVIGFTWAGTTAYGAQLFIDTDPTYNMAIRQRNANGVWQPWKKIYTANDAINASTVNSHTVNSDVPANAKFTDTVTTATTTGSGNAVTEISASNGALTVTKGTTFLTSHQDISGKADKSATVSTVTWDSTNKKFTKTINGTTTDIVTAANLRTGLNVADGAEVNQNAFSNVKVGSTTVAADSKTDTLELVGGTNITLTPDATNDKVTIAFSGTIPTVPNNFGTVKVGSTNVVADTTSDTLELVAGDNVTLTPDATNDKITIAATDTDTKNTAGSTDTSSKIFIVGATSQATNPQTYSQDTAYVGTDGHLYSDSKQVVNLSGSQALTNKTYNGYTLAGACAKGVVTSIGSNSTDLPTVTAVKNYVSNATSTPGYKLFKGTAPTPFDPTDYKIGEYWLVRTAGTYAGQTCEPGDILIVVNDYLASQGLSADDFTIVQGKLVSGTNIKTINNQSLLGSGNIAISGGVTIDDAMSSTSTNPVQNKVVLAAIQAAASAGSSGADGMTIDGWKICWGTTSLNTSSASGSGTYAAPYYVDSSSISLSYNGTPYVWCQVMGGWTGTRYATPYDISDTGFKIRLYASAKNSTSTTVRWLSIGIA